MNVMDIYDNLQGRGYRCDPPIPWSSGYSLAFKLYEDGNEDPAFTVRGVRSGEEYYLEEITCRPMFYPRWSDFWAVFESMDNHYRDENGRLFNRVIETCYLSRIDYTLDIRFPFAKIMEGLFVGQKQIVSVFDDLDNPYMQYEWRRGVFGSFHFGQKPIILKVYDKTNQSTRRRRGSPNASPCTRMELMVTQRSNIAGKVWDKYQAPNGSQDITFSGRLNELPQHMRHIRSGWSCPFVGVLVHDVKSAAAASSSRTETRIVRHEIDMGLLTNIYLRLGAARFWREHLGMFRLHPWRQQFQPSSLYREQVKTWMMGERHRQLRIPRNHALPDYLTRGWPMQLTNMGRPVFRRRTRTRNTRR